MGWSHYLQCTHTLLSPSEGKKLLEEENIEMENLPFIFQNDLGLKGLGANIGDVVKIQRPANGDFPEGIYYRRVVMGW